MSEERMGKGGQIKIYFGKCFRTFLHEKGWVSLVSTVVIAFILAWIIGDDTFGIYESTQYGIFAMICGCIWTGLFNSIQSICKERAIIKREHRTGLHLSSYIIAHMLFEFIQCTVEGALLTIVFDIMRDFPSSGVIFEWTGFEFFIGFTLTIFCADALGIMVSCIVKTQNAAMTVMPFVLIIQLVLCGLMFKLPDDAEVLKQLTVSKWGLCSVCSSADIEELPSEKDQVNEILSQVGAGLRLENDNGLEYEGSPEYVLVTWLVLLGYSVAYGAVGTLFLKLVDKDKR